MCRTLSEWWKGRDDIFWRGSGSGGRATRRARKGKKTAGSYGDVLAIDPIGKKLLDVFTIELKRGYNKFTIIDLLDQSGRGRSMWATWLMKARAAHINAGSISWCLISRRDHRTALITMPRLMANQLNFKPRSFIISKLKVSERNFNVRFHLITAPLKQFLEMVSRKDVKKVWNNCKGGTCSE